MDYGHKTTLRSGTVVQGSKLPKHETDVMRNKTWLAKCSHGYTYPSATPNVVYLTPITYHDVKAEFLQSYLNESAISSTEDI